MNPSIHMSPFKVFGCNSIYGHFGLLGDLQWWCAYYDLRYAAALMEHHNTSSPQWFCLDLLSSVVITSKEAVKNNYLELTINMAAMVRDQSFYIPRQYSRPTVLYSFYSHKGITEIIVKSFKTTVNKS